jgi:hypothetical protein
MAETQRAIARKSSMLTQARTKNADTTIIQRLHFLAFNVLITHHPRRILIRLISVYDKSSMNDVIIVTAAGVRKIKAANVFSWNPLKQLRFRISRNA